MDKKFDGCFIPSFASQIGPSSWHADTIGIDEHFTVLLSDFSRATKGMNVRMDIAIVVKYKPWILPIHKQRIFRFVTYAKDNGQYYWRAWPLGMPPNGWKTAEYSCVPPR